MKILLVGEYSRLHNSLKEGLIALGHDVVLIGNGDLFKQYPADFDIDATFFKKPIFSVLRKLYFKIFGYDFADHEVARKFKKTLPKLKDFDVIQLINVDALCIAPKMQISLLSDLFKQNKKVFLLCCGDDLVSISHYLKNEEKYSILTPYLENKKLKNRFAYSFKYLTKPYVNLHEFIYKHIVGVITTDIDYLITQQNQEEHLGMIPNPVNTDKIKYLALEQKDTIEIFHGINNLSEIRKGNSIFNEALSLLSKQYGNKVNITTTYSLPYSEFIEAYNKAHIVLDQVYAFDQGYNALEAMAKGKVVFTGAEQKWLDYYNLQENSVAINALPDAQQIAEKLEWLIANPEKIIEIGANARAFIEKHHNYKMIAQRYIDKWNSNV